MNACSSSAITPSVWSLLVLLLVSFAGGAVAAEPDAPAVLANDNRQHAGALVDGTLTLELRAGTGRWQPEGPAGPALTIEAFGEVGKPLTVPAPLIRVLEGTEIAASIRNELDSILVVHGLCTRGGPTCDRVEVQPHETRKVRFSSGPAGTYHYWASTLGAPVPFRELAGGFIVDPRDGPVEPDRVLVITEWSDLTRAQLREIMTSDAATETFVRLRPRLTFVINGLSWPATERFTYDRGERVRWRVINVSSQPHPLHLHGFYFEVHSVGDGMRDVRVDEGRRLVVTQLLTPGQTMAMVWTPERAGNWLFHCHVMHHVTPERRLDPGTHSHDATTVHTNHHAADPAGGMAGMVLGVVVREPGPAADVTHPAKPVTPRKLTLLMRETGRDGGVIAGAGFALREGDVTAADERATSPGPTLVLRRAEPVEITLVNDLQEATAIHWHGIELESYYDGVHGWSGMGRRTTPMIEPGGSFVVRFTPPRSGTFIYHTHLHDYRQLSSGLYGSLVVVEGNGPFDPATDHVIVLGRKGLQTPERSILTDPESVVINGERRPRLVWKAGARHRVRLINITPDDVFSVTLQGANGLVVWRPVAKDGAQLTMTGQDAVPARQTIAVGETYDFEYEAPAGRQTIWLEVRTLGGKWQAQAQVIVR